MQVMRGADVIADEGDRVYAHSRSRAVVTVACVVLAAIGLVWLGVRDANGVAHYVAGVLLLGLLVLWRLVSARFRPSNWLVRANARGLFIQLRSHLNHHFAPDDRIVAFVPYEEIRSARTVRERTDLPGRNGEGHTIHVRRLVELELAGDAVPLREAVAAEAARLAGRLRVARTIYRHVPVRCTMPSRVELDWSGVRPAERAFLGSLPPGVTIEPPIDSDRDLARVRHATRVEQEAYVTHLADVGRVIDAIAAARLLFGWDLETARAYVRGGSARGPRPPHDPAAR